jgi:hypothetical protein
MVMTDRLTAPLGALTAALDEPGADLKTILDALVDELSAAVSSFLGLRMTLQPLDGCPVTVTVMDTNPPLTAGACLTLSLGRPTSAGRDGTVVFYARNPGAFVDLAADLQRVHGQVHLDDQLPSAGDQAGRPGITGLAEHSMINQAIGVLITRGHLPGDAHAELRRRAAEALHTVPDAARHVLASTNAPQSHRVPATSVRGPAAGG